MNIVFDLFLPLSLAFIMFTLGLGLNGKNFLDILKKPKDFIVGTFSQVILLPIIAFLIVKIWPISPELAVGVMIIAAAPGGVTSNLLTSFAKGDVALSISLTAVISLLCVFTIPLIVFTSLDLLNPNVIISNLSLLDMALSMFLIVTVPVVIGMIFNKFVSKVTLFLEPIAKKISTLLFVIVLIGAVVSERENVITYFSQSGLITFTLNIVMMLVAFYLAKLLASGEKQRISITIECGLQNGTLAIFVAKFFGGGIYIVPAATYSLIMFATSLIFVYLIKK